MPERISDKGGRGTWKLLVRGKVEGLRKFGDGTWSDILQVP